MAYPPDPVEVSSAASNRGSTLTTAQNIVTSWTTRIAHRPASFSGGWWGVADALGHKLRLPAFLMRPICDHFDIAVGIPKEDLIYMDYTHNGKPTPWWLR